MRAAISPLTQCYRALLLKAGTAQRKSLHNEDKLIRRARGGDQRAYGILVRQHQEAIARTVTAMLGPIREVDDVVQSTFISCYESLSKFRDSAAFGTYLHRIAVNKSLDALRRRKRRRARFVDDIAAVLPDNSLSVDQKIEISDRVQHVHAAIAQLAPKYRAVVTLRLVEGLSTGETARALGIKYGTVLSRLSRGTRQLRTMLQNILDDTID